MTWMSKLLVKSPFGPLKAHMAKVVECADLAPEIVEACLADEQERVHDLAVQLSSLEAEADELKVNIRDSLPRSLFMPVSRGDLLSVLSAQDNVADCAEDLGVLLTMRKMEPPPTEVADLLRHLTISCVEVVHKAGEVVEALDSLVNSSFSGPEAQRVITLMDELDGLEHDADKVQDQLAKSFFAHEDAFKPAAIFVWMKVFNKIGDLANFSENVTKRIRLFMAS